MKEELQLKYCYKFIIVQKKIQFNLYLQSLNLLKKLLKKFKNELQLLYNLLMQLIEVSIVT